MSPRLFDQIDADEYVEHNRLIKANSSLSFIAWKQTNPKLPACIRCHCPDISHRVDTDNDWIHWCGLCGGCCGFAPPYPWKDLYATFGHPDEEPFGPHPAGEQEGVDWTYRYERSRPVADLVRNTTEYAYMSGTDTPALNPLAAPPAMPDDWMGSF